MTDPHTTEAVLDQLTRVLAADRFPAEARLHGQRLVDRLKAPVQVVVLGKARMGKSRLIQMLLGEAVAAPVADLPAFEVTHGPQARTLLVHEDERVEAWTGQPDDPLPDDTAMVRIERPFDLLRKMSLTEVTLQGPPEVQRSAASWAVDRADIVLWCTQNFDAVERALWATAPDALKDHSFLVLTKADQALMKGQLQDRLADLQTIVAEEFHSLFPVATIQAISARAASGAAREDLWTASGGRALEDAVLRLVDTGRRADADNALLFLSRYSAAIAKVASDPPTPGPTAPGQTAPGPTAPGMSTPATPDPAADLNRAEVYAEALAYLQDRADRLMADLDRTGAEDCGTILAHCLETATTLSDLLGEFAIEDGGLSDLHEDVQESADVMMLLQLEETEDAATDAVTLLLQLKKDLADRTVA